MDARRQPQRAQILVVFAGSLLVLLAIAVLVIDVGFVWLVRRQEQNAADPGAIAAARFIKPAPDRAAMREAACFFARQNGFFPDATDNGGCVPANDPAGTTLTVNYPPGPGAGTYQGRRGYVEVVIDREHRTFFGGLLGIASLPVTSNAVAAYSDGTSNAASLIALDPTGECQTGKISGHASVTITNSGAGGEGGYVQVNSSCGSATDDDVCSNGSGALKIDGTASLSAPYTYVNGSCVGDLGDAFPLDEGASQIGDPLEDIPPIDLDLFATGQCGSGGPMTSATGPNRKGCKFGGGGAGGGRATASPSLSPSPSPSGSAAPATRPCDASATVVNLDPGIYYGGWEIGNNVDIRLAPGIYVIAGGGINITGDGCLEAVSGDPSVEARILIFSTDNPAYRDACFAGGGASFECQGPLNFTADSTFNAKGLSAAPCPPVSSVGCPYRGMLLWQDAHGSRPDSDVRLGGQNNLNIAGTIYAPKADVVLDGGSSGRGVAAVQVISWHWTITGGATLTMPYDPNELYRLNQKGLVR